jgi:chromosome segregation protein
VERRSAALLLQSANEKLVEAVAGFHVYPEDGGAPPADVVDAVSAYLASRESTEGPSADQLVSTLAVLTAWLDDSADRDASAHDDVTRARNQRAQATDFAETKCRELEQALVVTQGAIVQRASSALDRTSQALDTLNRRAPNGLGAKLDDSVIPPNGPDKKWICQVTPRWRRNPAGPMLAYDNVTNTAQEKLFSIHLVLAALLAAPNPQGRVLILDELADSLGAEHRREVLDAIATVAREHGITILATCQDAIMSEASPHCREILYFHYPSKSEALNRPTRMFGVDSSGDRVELTAEALIEGRTLRL